LLELVSCDAELATGSDRDDTIILVDDLGVGMRHQGTYCGETTVDGVINKCVEAGWRGFGETVAAGELRHAKLVD
jgi:hypothetical protein